MKRRWLIGTALAAVVLVAGGVVVAAYSFDPDTQKGRIEAAVQRATGRKLTLAGPVRIAWGLSPALEAEDVSFANMPGGTRPEMVTVARAEARLRLLPLLEGQVEIAGVTLVRPDILLETDAAGRGNWQFQRPAAPVAAPGTGSAPSGHRAPPLVDAIRVENGRVTWHDGQTGRRLTAELPRATLLAGDGPVRVQAQAEFANTPATLDATLGTAAQLTGTAPGPVPVTVNAQLGQASVALQGTADPAEHTLSGHLQAAVPDLARTAALLQRPGLPPLHDVRLDATLQPGRWPEAFTLEAGASDLGALLPGLSLTELAYAAAPGQPARLAASGTMDGAAWQARSGVIPAANAVSLRGLAVTSAIGDLGGDLSVAWSPRPALRGTLVANRLDLDALHALHRPAPPQAAAPAPSPAPAPAASPAPLPPRIFPDAPLPWAELARADADLAVSAGTVHAGGADYHGVSARLALAGGTLRLDPVAVQAPEGRVDASFSADSASQAVVLNLRAGALAIDPLLRALGLPGGSSGAAEIDASLHAAGPSPHALAASLDGHAGVAVVDGEVSNAALAAALGDALRHAGAGLDAAGTSHVRCLAIRADAQAGQVTFPAMVLDSTRLSVEGSGTVNLGAETLALHLKPVLRLGGAGVSVPLLVEGSLRRPETRLDPAFGSNRVGVTIGAAVAPDPCGPALTAARDGRPGRIPEAAAPSKALKPADLLRGLLR